MPRPSFRLRVATPRDMPVLRALMNRAIAELLRPYLPPDAVSASFEIMGIDTQLVADGTYVVAERDGVILGCGGWSRRATMFGGDHTAGRDAALLDPAREPARVRAMYTHPEHTRKGVGRAILGACEAAARAEGFGHAELVATLAGEPLYRAAGYEVLESFEVPTSTGVPVPVRRMGKALFAPGAHDGRAFGRGAAARRDRPSSP
ncbi:MAG: GNAT family N-acetyltransferase [Sandaracinaceae bacterium]